MPHRPIKAHNEPFATNFLLVSAQPIQFGYSPDTPFIVFDLTENGAATLERQSEE
jgi:hypothetical protein